ncbi:hypothetical protein ACFQV2_17125 [Actinokineospora soli]|uniref:Amidohydrolase family protein n=1 Tax=Actinokineospora soli TaxID=1048753 RepID=A0ABW2TMJ5_9PSEU
MVGEPFRGTLPDGTVAGFLDAHNHVMADVAFGGNLICGKVFDAEGPRRRSPTASTTTRTASWPGSRTSPGTAPPPAPTTRSATRPSPTGPPTTRSPTRPPTTSGSSGPGAAGCG